MFKFSEFIHVSVLLLLFTLNLSWAYSVGPLPVVEFERKCNRRLRHAGLANRPPWRFAPLHRNKNTHVTLPVILESTDSTLSTDWLFDVVGRQLPISREHSFTGMFLAQAAIYLITDPTEPKYQLLFRALGVCNAKVVLYHIGDSGNINSWHAYDSNAIQIVLRSYHLDGLQQNKYHTKIIEIPAGYVSSFHFDPLTQTHAAGTAVKPPSARSTRWSYLTSPAYREINDAPLQDVAIDALGRMPGEYLYGDLVPPWKVRDILEDSVFCPCPQGQDHPNTFRFSEAVEAGCFPVVDHAEGYFTNFSATHTPYFDTERFLFQIVDWNYVGNLLTMASGGSGGSGAGESGSGASASASGASGGSESGSSSSASGASGGSGGEGSDGAPPKTLSLGALDTRQAEMMK